MRGSNSPRVLGLVIMQTAVSGPTTARKSSGSTRPAASDLSDTTLNPTIAADAGLVPWAVSGTTTTLRPVSPRALKYAFAMRSAVSSACAPAAGLSENAAMPNSEARLRSSSHISASAPCAAASGANGCRSRNAGMFAIASLMRGLYFMVHEPSG